MLSINFKNKQFTLTFDLGEYLGRSHQCKVILRKTLLNLKKQLWIKTVIISYKTSMLHWIAIPTIFKTLDNHCSWRTFDRRIFVTDFDYAGLSRWVQISSFLIQYNILLRQHNWKRLSKEKFLPYISFSLFKKKS